MIKQYRTQRGLSQEELGKLVGRSQATVVQWESPNGRLPARQLVPALAKVLELETGELEQLILREELFRSGVTDEREGSVAWGNVRTINGRSANIPTSVPLISVRARASVTSDWLEGCQADGLEESYPVYVPNIRLNEKHVVIEIESDSMEPRFRPGTLVLAESIKPGDIPYLSNVNVAIFFRQQFLVKRIKSNTMLTTNTLDLHSYNSDYGVVSVQSVDIRCVWRILGKVWEPD